MSTIHDAFRFELDLTAAQRDLVARSAGTARYAWNWGLAERKRRFEENTGKDRFTTAFSQINEWVKQKPAWAYKVSAWCAVSALRDLDVAYENVGKARRAGRQVGRRPVRLDRVHPEYAWCVPLDRLLRRRFRQQPRPDGLQ